MRLLGLVLLKLAIGVPVTIAVIALGYWVSDLAYSAGLWPIGAAMRVALILSVLSLIIAIPMWIILGIAAALGRVQNN